MAFRALLKSLLAEDLEKSGRCAVEPVDLLLERFKERGADLECLRVERLEEDGRSPAFVRGPCDPALLVPLEVLRT